MWVSRKCCSLMQFEIVEMKRNFFGIKLKRNHVMQCNVIKVDEISNRLQLNENSNFESILESLWNTKRCQVQPTFAC